MRRNSDPHIHVYYTCIVGGVMARMRSVVMIGGQERSVQVHVHTCTCIVHVNSFKETRQSKQLRLKTTLFFSREKMSCLGRDSNPRRSAC